MPFAPGNIWDAGMRQSENERLEVTDARIDHLPCMSDVAYPGVPFSTRNPRMPSSARAHTTATCEAVPLVIQVFSPLSTQHSPWRRAVVLMPAGFEPKPGSVSPKQ